MGMEKNRLNGYECNIILAINFVNSKQVNWLNPELKLIIFDQYWLLLKFFLN